MDRHFAERDPAHSEVDVLGIRSHLEWLCWEDNLVAATALGWAFIDNVAPLQG